MSTIRVNDIQNSMGNGKPTVNLETIITAEATQTITGKKTFITPIKVADAINPDEAISKGQLIDSKGNMGVQTTISSSQTLNTSHTGRLLVCSEGITVTLPSINTLTSGDLLIIHNSGLEEIQLALNGNTTTLRLNIVTGGETVILQSDGAAFYREVSRTSKAPAYEDLVQSLTYNTVFRADNDLTIYVQCIGSYKNGIQLVVGKTNNPTTLLHRVGDDINNNTKWISFQSFVPAGTYFKVEPYGTDGFETITIVAYKHK